MPQRARRMTSDDMVVSIYLRTFTTSIGFVNTAATCAANIPVVKDANGPYQLYLCTASRPHAPSTTITLLFNLFRYPASRTNKDNFKIPKMESWR